MTYPYQRPRRLRMQPHLRRICAEHRFSLEALIQPVFVTEHKKDAGTVLAMPDIESVWVEDLPAHLSQLMGMGIFCVALFPVIANKNKTPEGTYAYDAQSVIPKALSLATTHCSDMSVMADIALDPYTTSGQDGVLNEKNEIDNDRTIEALVRQSLLYAAAGAKMLAPSDMMDGRIGAIRAALEKQGHSDVVLVSYCAKYASCLYGPFREVVGSSAALGKADKKSYQMNPSNGNEALIEAKLDIEEGADILMVKPGLHYLDVIYRLRQAHPAVPIFAYHVSAEYVMTKTLAGRGQVCEKQLVLETMLAFLRAGATGIVTYYAKFIAMNKLHIK